MKTEIERLHEQFLDFASAIKENSKKTILWYKDAYRSYQRHAHILKPSELTRSSLELWIIQGKIEHNWSPKTRRERLKAMGLFCKWLMRDGYLSKNPLDEIDLPKLPKKIPEHLTREQAEDILRWARNYPYTYEFERLRAYAIFAMFLYTGVRKQELQNLELNDVDLGSRTVFIRAGKGAKDRMIPMNDKLVCICEQFLKDRRTIKSPSPYFFPPLRSSSRLSENVLNKLVEKIRRRSKISFTAHKLRHTFAVLMLEGGCNIYALSKMMGHSDIKTTTIYLSATAAHLQSQVALHPL